jgi:hypothetical protein
MAAAEAPIKSVTSVVKELADAVTAQARVCNRAWIALITVAVVVALPRPENNLPFNLGKVDQGTFYVVGFLILVALAIGFAAARAQLVRSQEIAQAEVEKLVALPRSGTDIHPRDVFDMLLPSVIRVAPLAQLLTGKHKFFTSEKGAPLGLRCLSTVYYVLLKIVTFFAYFGLPLYAFRQAYLSVHVTNPFFSIALTAFGVVAAVALSQVIVVEVRYGWRVAGIFLRPSDDRNDQPAT